MNQKMKKMTQKLSKLKLFDEVYDEIQKYNPKHSWYEEMVMYKKVWEHPKAKLINKNTFILNTVACDLYQHTDEPNRYVLVLGKTGNTHNYVFEGE